MTPLVLPLVLMQPMLCVNLTAHTGAGLEVAGVDAETDRERWRTVNLSKVRVAAGRETRHCGR